MLLGETVDAFNISMEALRLTTVEEIEKARKGEKNALEAQRRLEEESLRREEEMEELNGRLAATALDLERVEAQLIEEQLRPQLLQAELTAELLLVQELRTTITQLEIDATLVGASHAEQLEKAQLEMGTTLTLLSEMEGKVGALEGQVLVLEEERDRLKIAAVAFEEGIKAWREGMEKVESERALLAEQLDQIKQANRNLEVEKGSLEREKVDLDSAVEKLTVEVASRAAHLVAHEAELKMVTHSLNTASSRVKVLERELEQSNTIKNSIVVLRDDLAARLDATQVTQANLVARVKDLEDQIMRRALEKEQMEQDLVASATALELCRTELNEALSYVLPLSSTLLTHRSAHQELKQTNLANRLLLQQASTSTLTMLNIPFDASPSSLRTSNLVEDLEKVSNVLVAQRESLEQLEVRHDAMRTRLTHVREWMHSGSALLEEEMEPIETAALAVLGVEQGVEGAMGEMVAEVPSTSVEMEPEQELEVGEVTAERVEEEDLIEEVFGL